MKRKNNAAMDTLAAWRLSGAPWIITAYEAHNLTRGAVGVPLGARGASRPMRLAAVAVAYSRRIG